MQPFRQVTGTAAPLPQHNIDTDVIIRIERLVEGERDDLGAYCFEALRFLPDGRENPDFVFNKHGFRGAPILLAGRNFGCGSSREAAVWALAGIGVRCVIAPSFGDIFFNNCFQNGILPILLPEETIAGMMAEVEAADFTVDLETQTITTANRRQIPFQVADDRRTALLQGLDDIGATLQHEDAITAFQTADKKKRPWAYV